jgi:hypothetical protein
MTDPRPPKTIPEEKVAALLARAAELDRQVLTLDAVRSAALEAGISERAFDAAVAEFEGVAMPSVPKGAVANRPALLNRVMRWYQKITEPILLGVISFGCGMLAGRAEPLMLIGLVAWVAIIGRLALRGRDERSSGIFQVSTILTTLGLIAGFDTVHGYFAGPERLSVIALMGVAMFVLGTLFIHLRGARGDAPDEIPSATQ